MPRGAKPGERRGGRPKGTPNRKTLEVREMLDRLGCEPIEGMAKIAMGDVPCPQCDATGKIKDPDGKILLCPVCLGSKKQPIAVKTRASMYQGLAEFVYPKRKAVEHSGSIGDPVRDALVDAIAERMIRDRRSSR